MTPTPGPPSAALLAHLRTLYGANLYTRGTDVYPAMAFEAPPGQQDDVDSCLHPGLPQRLITRDKLAFYNWAYLHTLQNAGHTLFDAPTFILHRLERQPLRIRADLGRYFDMIATCAALEDELLEASAGTLLRSPSRTLYHQVVSPRGALRGGAGRSAALGVAVLTVFRHQGAYQALLGRRTAHHATNPGAIHLLPTFILQPGAPEPRPHEWSIRWQIRREWLEELFAWPESGATTPGAMDEHPALVDLDRMLATGDAELVLTGAVMNLLSLRLEITALLLIHDGGWYARATQAQPPARLALNAEVEGGQAILVPVASDAALRECLVPATPVAHMPPQGAVGLWLGVDQARRRLRE
jgi:hypothetical protein